MFTSALFHMEKAKTGLVHASAYSTGCTFFSATVHKGLPVYGDVMRALEQSAKVSCTQLSIAVRLRPCCAQIMNMSVKNKDLAIELAENMAELAESAFGWDSSEAAECRKEVCALLPCLHASLSAAAARTALQRGGRVD